MIRVVVLALVTLVGAACGSSTPEQARPATRTLQPCEEVQSEGNGQGDDPSTHPSAPDAAASAGGSTAYCMQLVLKQSNEREQIVQVVVLSNQLGDPLQDRIPLVYHPGGPGLSAVQAMLADPPAVDLNSYALLTWDGATSGNGPGACGPDSISFFTQRTPDDFADGAAKTATECLGSFGGPADVGAWAAAGELEAIREALGVDRFDFLTFSYGTAIAEAYLHDHPEYVRRAVLDAPVGLDVPWEVRLQAVRRVLGESADQLARSCGTDACKKILRNVSPDMSYEALREAVVRRKPSVGSGKLTLTPVMFDQAAELALRNEGNWIGFGSAVDEALAGDGGAIWRVAERMYLDLDRSVFYQSLCADIDRPTEPSSYVVGVDPLAFAYGSELAPCSGFPRGVARPATTAERPPEVLVVASRNDVLAPAALANLAPFLQSVGVLCETDVVGHTSFADPTINELIVEFLAAGDAEGVADRCSG